PPRQPRNWRVALRFTRPTGVTDGVLGCAIDAREDAMAKGLLIAAMDYSDVAEDEFHDWYDTEHIPARLAVPGFLNAERWLGSANPRQSVALYDLENVAVLQSAPYKAVGGANGSPWTKRVT